MVRVVTPAQIADAQQSHANVTKANKSMFETALLTLVSVVREGNEDRRLALMTAIQNAYDFAADGQHSLFCQVYELTHPVTCRCVPEESRYYSECPRHGEQARRSAEA